MKRFIESYHYSHNVNGVKIAHCFSIEFNGKQVGGVIYGALSTTAWKKFADSEKKVIELRRLVLLDEAGRNSESRVIGWTLRWIKKHYKDVEVIVSYADPAYGHSGVIYRASNFKYVGMTSPDKGFRDVETGKTFHSRALRTKYNGDYKPFVKRLRSKLEEGKLEVTILPVKHCYVFNMKQNMKQKSHTGSPHES